MKPRERVMCTLAGEQPDRVPFCEGSIAQNIARELMRCERQVSEREISDFFGRDVVVALMFPPYFADQGVGSDGQPYVTTGWIKTRADLDKIIFPDPREPAFYRHAQRVLDEKGDYAAAAAIKHGVAPMLLSMGLENFSYALADDPDLIQEVLKRYVDWQVIVTERLCQMGFDFIWSFDDVAFKSGPFCSRKTFQQFFMPAFRRSAEAITLPWIFHSDGNLMPVLDDLLMLGMSAIHPIEPGPMNLAEVKNKYGKRVCIVGNVSVDTLSAGTPDEVRESVRQCMTIGKPGARYMISSSNSIPSYAQPDNVRAMAEAIREFGAY
ncbi:MAG: hypothetical protein HY868_26340 [Chloroflexi bacterium]|nr:hypothetical protein [Chloroflexota bacterium]